MKIRQAKDIVVADFSNSLVVFNLKTYRSYILNDSASLLWKFCKTPRDLNQISRLLDSKYNIGLTRALKDVRNFVHQLRKKDLLYTS